MNYVDFRCVNPYAVKVGPPFFRIEDVCPCDPKLSNPTGRGVSGCPFGVTFDKQDTEFKPLMTLKNIDGNYVPEFVTSMPLGSLYPPEKMTPPQLQPRQLVRIGNTWRS